MQKGGTKTPNAPPHGANGTANARSTVPLDALSQGRFPDGIHHQSAWRAARLLGS